MDVLANPPTVVKGPELPVPMMAHCIVQLNTSMLMFISEKKTFFYNIPSQTWTNGADTNHVRSYSGCGLMTMGSDRIVVASGGFEIESRSTTELLNLDDSNGLKWSAGKN